jgi:hypothetical protein
MCSALCCDRAIRAAGCEALISVDTRKAEVAAAAVQAGTYSTAYCAVMSFHSFASLMRIPDELLSNVYASCYVQAPIW